MRSTAHTAGVLISGIGLWAGAVGTGCTRTIVTDPVATNYDAADLSADNEFWHALPTRSAISNDEGLHGLVLLADGSDPTGGYVGRLELAKQRGWVAEGFHEPPDMAMQRGTVSRAVARICEIEGGVMMRLTGGNARYSTRELLYLGILPGSSTENQAISGLEFVGVVSKAQDYMSLREYAAAQKGAGEGAAEPDGSGIGEERMPAVQEERPVLSPEPVETGDGVIGEMRPVEGGGR